MSHLDLPQSQIQDAQYEFPYHYIPKLTDGKFTSTRHWSWGYRYLGGLHFALDQLKKLNPASVIDIGCGDGRFLREVAAAFPNATLMGVDASDRAIQLATALNPELVFHTQDITAAPVTDLFQTATLIEVIEHILPANLPVFLSAVAELIQPGGSIVVTVPHLNKPLISKHHQHFTAMTLQETLAPHFTDIELIPFDVAARCSPMMWILDKILGGKGRWFVFTQQRLLNIAYQAYLRRYLYAKSETQCERIAAVAKKR